MNSLQKLTPQITRKEAREAWESQTLQILQFRLDSSEIIIVKEFIPVVEATLEKLVNLSQLIPKPELRFELIKNSGKLLFISESTTLLELDTVTNRLKIMVYPGVLIRRIESSIFALALEQYDEYRMTEISVSSFDMREHGEHKYLEEVEERLVNRSVNFSVVIRINRKLKKYFTY